MKRLALSLFLAFAAPLAAQAEAPSQSLPVQLRQGSAIDGDTIRLGDIWDNLGDKADTVVAAAPQPGKRVTLNARWLAAVAVNNKIDWHPVTTLDHVVVERNGQMVDPAMIEREVREALDMEGLPQGSGFEITNRTALAVTIASTVQPTVAIRDLLLDPRTQRFTAVAEIPAGSPAATRLKVYGRTFTMTRLPVLARAFNRGEAISEADIQWIEVRDEGVRQDLATDSRQMIGLEPRYSLRAGQPVRLADLQRPVLVERNATVTLVLRTPFMTLSTQGRAIDEGGRGDVIKVTNLQTKQTVEGKVDGPNMVSVAPTGIRVLSN